MALRLFLGIAAGVALGALVGHFGKCSSGACPLTANPFRGAIYGGILGAVFAFSLDGSVRPKVNAAPSESMTREGVPGKGAQVDGVVHVSTPADFARYVLNASKPCMADFYSDRCGPCRMLAPTVEQLAAKYDGRAVICKVNLDLAPALAAPYRIMGIPAVLFFDGGKEAHRLTGLRKQADYEDVLDKMLEK
jgi:thioredoxin 1